MLRAPLLLHRGRVWPAPDAAACDALPQRCFVLLAAGAGATPALSLFSARMSSPCFLSLHNLTSRIKQPALFPASSVTMRSALLCALALLLVPAAHAFWIIRHQPLVTQRFDAIVSPGGISGHAHAFVGSGAIDGSSTRKSLRGAHAKGACTTTGLRADSSSYWAPQVRRPPAVL